MARFLPNSGDIILDAVLTDEGRRRMAGGAGQSKFSIDMYAFGDDEVNYELWDASAATAYKDLNILSTPILEAITDNASALKHKLKSMLPNKDYLYLPNLIVRTSSQTGDNRGLPFAASPNSDKYVVLTTTDAYALVETLWTTTGIDGWINGTSAINAKDKVIVIDQGIKTAAGGNDWSVKLSEELEENQYIIQIDDRFGTIVDPTGAGAVSQKSYVDDDYIATYVVSDPTGNHWQTRPLSAEKISDHSGARGRRFWFSIMASDNLTKSTAYFEEFGNTLAAAFPTGESGHVLDTIVRVDGWKTGMSLDIPIRFLREIP